MLRRPMARQPEKKLPLSSMIESGYRLLGVCCLSAHEGKTCWHYWTVRIADLVGAGVDPETSMSDLALSCPRCGRGGEALDVRMDMGEHYARCPGQTGHSQGALYRPSDPAAPRVTGLATQDAEEALRRGRYP